MKKHFQCNSKSFLVRSFWAACADLVNIKILLNSERAANEITKKINNERAHLCLWFKSQIYCYVATLGYSECALLFASRWALSQGVILPERQKTLCLRRDPASSRHVSSYILWTVFPLPSPSVMWAVNCTENLSVTDTFSTWSAVRQAWGERLQIWHWAHKHTHRERERNSHCWLLLMSKHGINNKTHQHPPKKNLRERVLLYKSEILQTKKGYFMVFTNHRHSGSGWKGAQWVTCSNLHQTGSFQITF